MGFPRQQYWSGLPSSFPGNLSDPAIEPKSPALASRFFTTDPPGKPPKRWYKLLFLFMLHSHFIYVTFQSPVLSKRQNYSPEKWSVAVTHNKRCENGYPILITTLGVLRYLEADLGVGGKIWPWGGSSTNRIYLGNTLVDLHIRWNLSQQKTVQRDNCPTGGNYFTTKKGSMTSEFREKGVRGDVAH